ncbi:hypothetical protein HaLaN_25322, partial [Haematococcus lacustris]
PLAGSGGIAARRERQYSTLTTSQAPLIEVGAPFATFNAKLAELLAALQDMAAAAMQQDSSDGRNAERSLETRDEVEALQGLIERLDIQHTAASQDPSLRNGREAPGPGAGAVGGRTTQQLYNSLAAAAAALQ